MPLPPVTSNVCPETYEARGDARLQKMLLVVLCSHRGEHTYKSAAAAASSGVPPLLNGMEAYALASAVAGVGAPGTPRATFLPSISIVAPPSLAAVNLRIASVNKELEM